MLDWIAGSIAIHFVGLVCDSVHGVWVEKSPLGLYKFQCKAEKIIFKNQRQKLILCYSLIGFGLDCKSILKCGFG